MPTRRDRITITLWQGVIEIPWTSREDLLDEITDGTGEIRCRIQIHADGMPPALTDPVFTDRRNVRR